MFVLPLYFFFPSFAFWTCASYPVWMQHPASSFVCSRRLPQIKQFTVQPAFPSTTPSFHSSNLQYDVFVYTFGVQKCNQSHLIEAIPGRYLDNSPQAQAEHSFEHANIRPGVTSKHIIDILGTIMMVPFHWVGPKSTGRPDWPDSFPSAMRTHYRHGAACGKQTAQPTHFGWWCTHQTPPAHDWFQSSFWPIWICGD